MKEQHEKIIEHLNKIVAATETAHSFLPRFSTRNDAESALSDTLIAILHEAHAAKEMAQREQVATP